MARIRIRLTRTTMEALRRRATLEGTSASAAARGILEEVLGGRVRTAARRLRTAADLFPFIGIIKDDPENVAEEHNRFLDSDSITY